MTEEQIATIVDQQDLVELAQEHVQLKRAGPSWVACCPFHAEKTPSFNVSTTGHRHMAYCFGCGWGGDALTFVQEIEGWSFQEAIQHLAARVGIQVDVTSGRDEQASRDKRALQGTLAAAQASYQAAYRGSPAEQYCVTRGIQPDEAAKWGIGFGVDLYLDPTLQVAAGILHREQSGSRFANRITFPVRNQRGETIGWSARALPGAPDEKRRKYTNTPETALYHKSEALYGIDQAKRAILKSGRVIIVEGQMDTIACHQAGLTETVAPCGTALTTEQARQLARLTSVAILCFDPDAAGRKAEQRAIPILEQAGITCRVARLEQDPSDAGPKATLAAIEQAEDYFICRARESKAEPDPQSHMRAIRELESDLGALQDARYREVARQAASKALGQPLTPNTRGQQRKRYDAPTGPTLDDQTAALLMGLRAHPYLKANPERLRGTRYWAPVQDAATRPQWADRPTAAQAPAAAAIKAEVAPPGYRDTAAAIESAYLEAAEAAVARFEQEATPVDQEEAGAAITFLRSMK